MQACSTEADLLRRINQLPGYDDRKNDILYVPKSEDCQSDDVLVYFGGDIQDFRQNMENHSESKNYIQWSLENVGALLQQKFPCRHVVIVRPSRYDQGIFSCYDNFVPSGDYGIPTFVNSNRALQHLEQLLTNLAAWINLNRQISEKSNHNVKARRTCRQQLVNFDKSRVTLIGFSKGCVVLNQLIYEFHFLHTKEPSSRECNLMSRIADIHFMDGGHAGEKDTWVTDRSILNTFSTLAISVYIHVTPYQVQDKMRPWIGSEEKIFYETLRELKAKVFHTLYFEHERPSLNKHFEILNSFAST